jgi:hypothetical protein
VSGFAEGYVDVAARIEEFYAKHPEGSLQMDPPEWVEVNGEMFIMGRAHAYRNPQDPRPGIGTAWEPVPGRTPYTKGSEVMNLETSAWGRALAALGIATRNGIATAQEVSGAEGRRAEPGPSTGRSGAASGRTGSASEKQIGYLKTLMRKANMAEHTLADMASTVLGFETPAAGLEALSKDQATQLIDAIKKMLDGQVVTRHTGPPPGDDPWAPVDPMTGELAL